MSKEPELNAKSKKFWNNARTLTTKTRFINFTDGNPIELTIVDWEIRDYDTPWGKKPGIISENGKILKVESIRLQFELSRFLGTPSILRITRFDSEPNSRDTWYSVEKMSPDGKWEE